MHIPDLAPFNLGGAHYDGIIVLAVGWLDKQHPFPRGDVHSDLIPRLWKFVSYRHKQLLGLRPCNICRTDVTFGSHRGKELVAGGGEIMAFWHDAGFDAPDMIIHHISQYLPP